MDIKAVRKIRLAQLFEEMGSATEVAKAAETSASYLSQIVSPKGKRNVGHELARKIEVACNKPYGWMDQIETEVSEPAASYSIDRSIATPDFIDIPYFRGAEVSAGNGAVIHSDAANGSLTYRKDWIRQNGWSPNNLVVVRCKGDSMEPRVGDGDVVLINTAFEKIIDNKIYAINYAGEAKIKRLEAKLKRKAKK